MNVRVLFFGILKDVAGRDCEDLTLADPAKVEDVLQHYRSRIAPLNGMLNSIAVAVNQEYARPETILNPGDEVALLPPVSGGAPRAQLTRTIIEATAISDAIRQPQDGAVVIFEGIVRNHSCGRRTLYLEYEAYEEMGLKQLESLLDQALSKYQIREAVIVHRLGHLKIGETSVLIVVASAHRAAAFDACRWLIDTLKRTVPIWKKEFFEDGAVWADGEPFPEAVSTAASSTNSQNSASK